VGKLSQHSFLVTGLVQSHHHEHYVSALMRSTMYAVFEGKHMLLATTVFSMKHYVSLCVELALVALRADPSAQVVPVIFYFFNGPVQSYHHAHDVSTLMRWTLLLFL